MKPDTCPWEEIKMRTGHWPVTMNAWHDGVYTASVVWPGSSQCRWILAPRHPVAWQTLSSNILGDWVWSLPFRRQKSNHITKPKPKVLLGLAFLCLKGKFVFQNLLYEAKDPIYFSDSPFNPQYDSEPRHTELLPRPPTNLKESKCLLVSVHLTRVHHSIPFSAFHAPQAVCVLWSFLLFLLVRLAHLSLDTQDICIPIY